MNEIEARPYGPEITDTEHETLRRQVTLLEDDIISWHEAPMPTTYQLDVYAEKLNELSQSLGNYYMLIDLSRAARPTPDILEHVRKIIAGQKHLAHAAVFTGKNFMLNMAAKFALARIGFSSYSIHQTRNEALDAIQSARR